MKVGIIANTGKPEARATIERLSSVLAARGIATLLDDESADFMGQPGGLDGPALAAACEVIAVLGGDGTMLNAVAKLGPTEKTIAGINIGTLGFLTSCTDDEIEPFAEALISGSYKTSRRSLLTATVIAADGSQSHYHALNEVVLARGQTGRLVSLSAYVDGELLNHYRADGLIVATPTGSTAYSLSAGGPLISPGAAATVITPICPHTLSQRSLIIGDDALVELTPENADEAPMIFTVDGRDIVTIHHGDRIQVRKAGHALNLLRLQGHSFYAALRQKLNWRGG
ncbi:NAD(+)/NADH kinase [Luteolibacter sp. GHJ8]|jgi:NAD+ kinase|uniref:NAD kinase n=1 Tax=Luteolibacter rhizosphaerae TaxID=2989719 RepID=A0ABT3G4Q4_9BACT|nr:NAD(+)/NADH kinase [Luteolibacter rhizosphaerae]MCW1914474.1 NAD(+)/NADH kinase [Luteolibacter rhizosphaerae]